MFLTGYTLRVVLSDCNPSSQKVNALVDLSQDIGEVLPYLNTILKGRQYNQEERSLSVKRGAHFITLWPHQIAITKLEDENEARAVTEELVGILNEAYERRDQIKPTYTSRPIPRPLEIFKLLPGRNCKECGEPTCMAFALKMVNEEVEWKKCPILLSEEYEKNRLKLLEVSPDSGGLGTAI